MTYHAAIRRAVVARLVSDPALADTVFSSPPVNFEPPVVVVGQITADPVATKSGDAGWYTIGIEFWAQTFAPLDLDALSQAGSAAMRAAVLTDADATLGGLNFAGETDAYNPDAPGGPILSRTQSWRVFAQAST